MTHIRRIAVVEGWKFQPLYVFRLDSLHKGLSASYAVTGIAEHEEGRDDEQGEQDSYKCKPAVSRDAVALAAQILAQRRLGLPHTLLYMAERID